MKKSNSILTSAFLPIILFSTNVFPQKKSNDIPAKQKIEKCATMEMTNLSDQQHPRLKKLRDSLYAETANELRNGNVSRQRGTVYTIPVVVHVIHNNSTENINESQVKSQFKALNDDYRKIAGTRGDGDGVDTEIQFQLANIDMYGNYTTGIEKIKSTLTTHNKTNDRNLKDLSRWDPHKYLNIYVVRSITPSEVLGYAFLPPAFPPTDGLVIRHTAFGTSGTVTNPTTFGRTGTHEIGHYLGLYHPWGTNPGDCSDDDGITDTPNCEFEYYAAPPLCTAPTQCGNVRQIENYMDYSDDECMSMFTAGQTTVMKNVVTVSGYRTTLVSSTNLKATGATAPSTGVDAWALVVTGPAPRICHSIFTPKLIVKNNGSEIITNCDVVYKLDNKIVDTLNFTGSISPGVSQELTFTQDTVTTQTTHTINFTVQNPNGGADVLSSNNSVTFSFDFTDSTYAIPYIQTFESSSFPPSGWKRYDLNSNNKWERYAKGAFGYSSYSARMNNADGTEAYIGQVDFLLSPHFDLSNVQSPNLKFSVAYAATNSQYYDKLSVFISTNCSDSWTQIYSKTGYLKSTGKLPTADTTQSYFVPTTSQWRTETIDLTAYEGDPDVMFKVESQFGWGNFLYMDDFTVDGQIIIGVQPVASTNTEINIYPNPSEGLYNLQINLMKESRVNVELYNYQGIKIENIFHGTATNKNLQINLNEKAAGIYMVVTDIDGMKIVKMVVNE
ncbi:MAG: hypothetical protein A3H98_06370 [Bacteroidetes bacterium RIFCSPLOWO2_02_FULL_36_8]|nr:MAG: hypothetical protein A3H98_06370 [Bacteroidetes bacterium RIFCSPLOWO2_02_FULL_36_8]OFY71194.1 MAG: hypothetical protein A3G23_10475 [Bacteroidetes bacterium RIFCSPLOWO2_12_FULL_37_12]